MDPITPPPNAKAIMPGFSNGTYVEFPFAGHGPTRSVKCGGDMLNAFYDDPAAEPDLACVEEMEEPEIYAPLFVSRVAPRLLAMAEEDEKQLAVPGAWGGGSLSVLLLAFVMPNTQQIMNYVPPQGTYGAHVARPVPDLMQWRPALPWAAGAGLAFGLCLMFMTQISEFIYFQF